jgi:hypothetical protein
MMMKFVLFVASGIAALVIIAALPQEAKTVPMVVDCFRSGLAVRTTTPNRQGEDGPLPNSHTQQFQEFWF